VVDMGSSTVKAGYAGEDTPKAVFPSAVGWLAKDQESAGERDGGDVQMDEGAGATKGGGGGGTKEYFVNDLSYRRDHMEMTSPFNAEGLLEDWDVVEALWAHTLKKRLVVGALARAGPERRNSRGLAVEAPRAARCDTVSLHAHLGVCVELKDLELRV